MVNLDGQQILFYRSNPSRAAVDAFIDEVLKRRDSYLLDKFGTLDKGLPYDNQLYNLQWLNRNWVLSDEEYRAREQQLKRMFNLETRPIGF